MNSKLILHMDTSSQQPGEVQPNEPLDKISTDVYRTNKLYKNDLSERQSASKSEYWNIVCFHKSGFHWWVTTSLKFWRLERLKLKIFILCLTDSNSVTLSLAHVSIMILWFSDYSLKLQSVTFGALAVNKLNCMRLAEEHCLPLCLCLWQITQVLGYSAAVPTRTSLK